MFKVLKKSKKIFKKITPKKPCIFNQNRLKA